VTHHLGTGFLKNKNLGGLAFLFLHFVIYFFSFFLFKYKKKEQFKELKKVEEEAFQKQVG
jgi:hypothetical protein